MIKTTKIKLKKARTELHHDIGEAVAAFAEKTGRMVLDTTWDFEVCHDEDGIVVQFSICNMQSEISEKIKQKKEKSNG